MCWNVRRLAERLGIGVDEIALRLPECERADFAEAMKVTFEDYLLSARACLRENGIVRSLIRLMGGRRE